MDRTVQIIQPKLAPLPHFLRVAAYARVSMKDDGMMHSLEAQVSYYNKMIHEHNGWVYCGVYVDEGLTGTKESRPAFQRMMTDCHNGKLDMIITKSISRFARNTVTTLETIRELKGIGINVFFEKENIHTLSSKGEFLITTLAAVAQAESYSVSENQKWHIRKKYERGENVCWSHLFGYRIHGKDIVVYEAEARIVREIFMRFLNGDTMQTIMTDLNSRNVVPVLGGKWTNNAIRRLLSNEKYVGEQLLQKTFINNYIEKKEVVNNGELPMYLVRNSHPPIIDKDIFDAVQKKLTTIAEKAKNWKKRENTPFHSMIQCLNCGCNYNCITTNGSVGFNCPTYTHYGKDRCFGKKIPLETLYRETTAVLGLAQFNARIFADKISHILVPKPNHLIYVFKDGHQVERVWQDRSRRESWTPEMKEEAKQRTLRQKKEREYERNIL